MKDEIFTPTQNESPQILAGGEVFRATERHQQAHPPLFAGGGAQSCSDFIHRPRRHRFLQQRRRAGPDNPPNTGRQAHQRDPAPFGSSPGPVRKAGEFDESAAVAGFESRRRQTEVAWSPAPEVG